MTQYIRYPATAIQAISAIFIILGVLLSGCSRVSQEAELKQEMPQPDGLQIELVEPLFPAAVGMETLNIRIADAQNQPIDNAKIKVRADMTHAGMIPVLAETENGNDGMYQLPLEWSMSGDWIVTVQVSLPDGTVAEQTFPRTIANDPADCEHEDKNKP